MKIAITSTGPSLDDNVEVRFGRCAYFLIVDTDTMQYESIENPNTALGGGAGIQSAQLMSEKGVTTVLTGNCGPNAFNVLGQAKIQVVVGVNGVVKNAVELFKTGKLSSASSPNVGSHYGMGDGGGIGRGRGMGRGMGMGMASRQNTDQQLTDLKQQEEELQKQKKEINRKINKLEKKRKAVAVIDHEKCAGCGICLDVCPVGAIEVDGQAIINEDVCTGCAACVAECPNEAVTVVQKKIN